MLILNYLYLYYFFYKNHNFIMILSLFFGWTLIKVNKKIIKANFFFFNLIITKKYYLNLIFVWKLFKEFFLRIVKNHKLNFYIKGVALKLLIFNKKIYFRTILSNKIILNNLFNFKLILIKKSVLTIFSRFFKLLKMYLLILKRYSKNFKYKKIGIYQKNESIFLKKGKISKK